MKRKLARIERIDDIKPIKGADYIDVAIVGGHSVVIGKDDGYKVGDKVIYYERNSYLPIDERYEFLRKYSSYKKLKFEGVRMGYRYVDDEILEFDGNEELRSQMRDEGFKIRAPRFRGVFSDGLIMPVEAFKEEINDYLKSTNKELVVGLDLTEVLDIEPFVHPLNDDYLKRISFSIIEFHDENDS